MKIILSLVFAVTFSITSAQSWKELKSAATKAKELITTNGKVNLYPTQYFVQTTMIR